MIKYDRLEELASFLTKMSAKKFNFNQVVTDAKEVRIGSKQEVCGSICCAVGWTPRLWPSEVQWQKTSFNYGPQFVLVFLTDEGLEQTQDYADVAHKIFNISFSDACDLFSPTSDLYEDDCGSGREIKIHRIAWEKYLPNNLTSKSLHSKAHPRTVAASIRAFIKWKKAETKKKSASRKGKR